MAATILIAAAVFFFPAAMALAASMDVVTMTIPNRVCAALAIGYFVLALAVGLPAQTILVNLSCGAAVLAVMFAMFALGWIGGGDAKLAAAIALWLGWGALLDYSLSAAIYGGALTIVILLGRRQVAAAVVVAPRLDRPPARLEDRRSLRRRARRGGHDVLSAHRNLARRGRPVTLRRTSSEFANQLDTPD